MDDSREIARATADAAPAQPGALGLYLAGLAPGSRRAQLWRLERAAALLERTGVIDWPSLTYADAVAIRARAAERYAPRTASAIVAAVRAVCREAWRAGLMDGELYRRIQSVPPVKGQSAPTGRWVSRGELRALFDSCDQSSTGKRDAAMLALLFGAGLRRGELVALKLEDLEGAAIVVQEGKGRKGRRVALAPGVIEAVNAWSGELEGGFLIRRVNKGGHISALGITGEAVRRRLLVLAARAGIDSFRPHDARRSYASGLLDSGADLAVVARLLGHASVQVTAGYDRRGARAESEAAGLVRLPYASASLKPEPARETAPSPKEIPDTLEDAGSS